MSTTAEKLQKIKSIKNDLKEKINAKGGSITDTTPFAEYPIQVENISGGNSYDYVVTFINWNGDILQTNYVMSGDSVTYEGVTPTKSVDDDYIYIFSGWSNDTTNVTSDVVAIAEFEQKECTVIKLNLTNSSHLQPTVNIQGFVGTYTIDWGDGVVETYTSGTTQNIACLKSTAYSTTGEYIIKVSIDYSYKTGSTQAISLEYGSSGSILPYRRAVTRWEFQEGLFNIIREKMFYYSQNLTNIIIPEGVINIEPNSFEGCLKLESVMLPNSLIDIHRNAFYFCSQLTNITIPESVTSISDSAFYGCSKLTSVIIPKGMTAIAMNTFYDCTSLTNVTILGDITTLHISAIRGCTSLTNITIPKSVTKISATGLYIGSSTNKATITFESEIPCTIESSSFNASALEQIRVPIDSVDAYKSATNWSAYADYIVGYEPEDQITITENGTYDVTNKTTAIVNVESSGGGSVDTTGKHKVTYFDLDGSELKVEYVEDGGTTTPPSDPNYDSEYLQFDCWNYDVANLVVDRDINIGAIYETITGDTYLFIRLTENIGLEIPSLKITGATSIDWGDGTVDTNLTHTYADYGEYVIKVSGMTKTEYGLFNGSYDSPYTYSLQKMYLGNSVTTIGTSAFSNCKSLAIISIPNTASIEGAVFYNCYSLTSIIIPDSVTSIGQRAFYYCYSLTSIIIPEGVTSIGYSAFDSCTSLTSIIIPEGVTSIEKRAFYGCYSLTSIIIPEGVTSIGDNAFYGCYSLVNYIFNCVSVPTLTTANSFLSINYSATIWVRDELVEEYKSATNWSTYASYIKPLSSMSDKLREELGLWYKENII